MKRAYLILLPGLILMAMTACHHNEYCGDSTDGPWGDWCDCGPDCRDGYEDPYALCNSSADCDPGKICSPHGECLQTVPDCPLTPECLGDPEGYVPDWRGIDPSYAGSFSVDGTEGLCLVHIDFYEDHFYGEGEVLIGQEGWGGELRWLILTGSRDQDQLSGQIIDPFQGSREFDAVFSATLLSASEIQGSFQVSSDEGEITGQFHLLRVSPCGCETGDACQEDPDCPQGMRCLDGECLPADDSCTFNSECLEDQVCLDGHCTSLCADDSDCPQGQVCEANVCVPACPHECCGDTDCAQGELCIENLCVAECPQECYQDADCPEGDVCLDNSCQTPCEHWCDCQEGEICEDGICVDPNAEPTTCETDCDCDYTAGERCIQGSCQTP